MPGRKTPKTDLLVTWLRVVFYCRAYFAFKDCIFKIPLSSECPDDHLLSSVREHSAYLTSVMDGFDFLQCEYMFCWHDFVEGTKQQECSYSYHSIAAVNVDSEKCRHLRTFVDCVRFMALIREPQCLHLDIEWLVSTEMSLAGISTCEYPDPALVGSFPETLPEICNSSIAHRHLLKYYCINEFNISVLQDHDDRCRFEISLHGCMLEIFQMNGVPCTVDDVVEVAHRPEVRTGLLDFVDAECHETGLSSESECMKNFYMIVGKREVQQCHDYLYHFQELMSVMTLDDVNAISSSSGQNSLKCSVFEETLMCFMRHGNSVVTNCTADDLAPALKRVLHISYQFMTQESPIGGIPEITYEGCESSLTRQFPTRECPASSLMADLIVAKCSSEILWQIMSTGGHPCSAIGTFISCVQTVPVPNGDICSQDYLWNATDEYSSYITQHIGGSADLCRGCTAYGSTYQEYVGFTIFSKACMLQTLSNTSVQECLDVCTSLERCLSVSYQHSPSLCIAHQCSFVTHPQDWVEWGEEMDTTTYVKDCDYNQTIVQCPAGQEFNLASATCVDCPVGTYKEDVYGHCILCPTSFKTDGVGATSVYDCTTPYFYCNTVTDCMDSQMDCTNNTCLCPPDHYYHFMTDQCVAFACHNISDGYLKLPSQAVHAEDSCIISFDFGTTLEQCLQDCDLDPTCQADTYGYHYVECMLLRCYDLSTRYGLHALLFDSFIKACPQGVLECYLNGTIRLPNPDPAVYIDAMAIQDEGSQNATKCLVEARGSDILITGCSMNSEITVFLSNRTLGDDDVFSGRKSQAHRIRCNNIPDGGITIDVIGSLVPNTACYPNGTIRFPNPDPAVYVDAMAIQDQGSQQATKCLVDPRGPYIVITGCSANYEITVFFSNRSLGDDDVFGGRQSQAYTIRCNDLPESGVTRIVEDSFGPRLEVTSQAAITPSFIVTSALRSESVTGEIVSTAIVGETIYWTIDIPLEYLGRPTCYAYSGTSSSGVPSVQLVLNGCTLDSSLVAEQFSEVGIPVDQTNRIWTTLYAFRFYNSDDVYLECSVKVCRASSDSCNYVSITISSLGKHAHAKCVFLYPDIPTLLKQYKS